MVVSYWLTAPMRTILPIFLRENQHALRRDVWNTCLLSFFCFVLFCFLFCLVYIVFASITSFFVNWGYFLSHIYTSTKKDGHQPSMNICSIKAFEYYDFDTRVLGMGFIFLLIPGNISRFRWRFVCFVLFCFVLFCFSWLKENYLTLFRFTK